MTDQWGRPDPNQYPQYPAGGQNPSDPNQYPQYPPQYPQYPGGQYPSAPPPGYVDPRYGYGGYRAQPRDNGLATAALVCSIAGIFLCVLVTIAGIVMGHIALSQIRQTGEGGAGRAKAALIVGYIGVALGVVGIVAYVTLIKHDS